MNKISPSIIRSEIFNMTIKFYKKMEKYEIYWDLYPSCNSPTNFDELIHKVYKIIKYENFNIMDNESIHKRISLIILASYYILISISNEGFVDSMFIIEDYINVYNEGFIKQLHIKHREVPLINTIIMEELNSL